MTLINCCNMIRTLLPCTRKEAEITHSSSQLRGVRRSGGQNADMWALLVLQVMSNGKLPPMLGTLTVTPIAINKK